MDEGSVKTGVDALLEILKQEQKISLVDAAKKLGISEKTIKLWVDFLVEEKVVGMEYKFTKPYVYLNKTQEEEHVHVKKDETPDMKTFKTDFEERAATSNIPTQQIAFLWKDHLLNQVEVEKPFFYREARKRGLSNIDDLWKEYQELLVNR